MNLQKSRREQSDRNRIFFNINRASITESKNTEANLSSNNSQNVQYFWEDEEEYVSQR